jgi:large subunit ribosomal protein L25
MQQIELNAAPRKVIGKQVKALRRAGLVPANLYGRSVKPLALQVDAKSLNRVLAHASTSRLITLNVEGRPESLMALAREIQREPITGSLYHVDLFAVSMTERVKLDVRIVLTGESPAVQRGEGVLVHALNTIEIECLPGDLIDSIRLDISGLDKVDARLAVKDLPVPAGIQISVDPDETVVLVSPIREEKAEEVVVPTGEAAAEVEVIEKGKKEEEEPEEG